MMTLDLSHELLVATICTFNGSKPQDSRNCQIGNVRGHQHATCGESALTFLYQGPRDTNAAPKSIIRLVPQSTIENKWNVLDQATQSRVESIYRSINLPVISQFETERNKIEAQDAATLISRSLCRRLPKMPFPPNIKPSQFDYSVISASNVSKLPHHIESQVRS